MTPVEVFKLQRWVDHEWSKDPDSHPAIIDSLGYGEHRARRIAMLNLARLELGLEPLFNDEVERPALTLLRRLWESDCWASGDEAD